MSDPTTALKTLFACLASTFVLPLSAETLTTVEPQPKAISFDQLGAEAQKQYVGDGIGITPTAGGARLRAIMQRIEGEATAEGLWLSSTAEEDAGLVNRFRVRAVETGRTGRMRQITPTGVVRATQDAAVWLRPGLTEEYTVSSEGVRQDFVVAAQPAGAGELVVELEVTGARAQQAAHGATLTLDATGRALAYHRLWVSDATGRELIARLEVPAPDRLRVVVEDAGAVYPVRIDPTFSDADWVSLNPGIAGANDIVWAMAVDGSGNLFVGGRFTLIGTVEANRIVKWNGSVWSPLGSGMDGTVSALVVSGGDLYAGGSFSNAGGTSARYIAKWDGSVWSALSTGVDGSVRALAVSGSDLYVGGIFDLAGGTAANQIAKWNGSVWSALGSGLVEGDVFALAVSGSDLYMGGVFTEVGGTSANNIAKWNGSGWSALGAGVNSTVYALAASGSDLYVGGGFTNAGGAVIRRIAKWNGSSWSGLGAGAQGGDVTALAVSGSDVYAGGDFTMAGSVQADRIAKWNGSVWSALGTGMADPVHALAVSGSHVYAGGDFNNAGGTVADEVAKWNGSVWSALGSVMDRQVTALAVSGSDVYAGGSFTTAGGMSASRIAKWNGSVWSALGTGMNGEVTALAVSGGDLYAGGDFTTAGGMAASRIAKWNGSAWSALGTGVGGMVSALAVSGSDLYAGGTFTTAGGMAASRIAKWNGSAWSALGSGMDGPVGALAENGSDLYAGGFFTTAGGMEVSRIAKWDGSVWSALGTGIDGLVYALAVSGSDLYAGGEFTEAGGMAANRIAKWDGSGWSALGMGLNSRVSELAVSGSDLYAGGFFTTAGGMAVSRIAKWDGSGWSALGTGMSSSVLALAVDNANHLFVGGTFTHAGTTLSPFIAQANLPAAVPAVTLVNPASGTTAGGTSVTITGTNFTGVTGVTFGGAAATGVNVVNATTLTCITPARPAGSASVIVTASSGSNAANSLYTYVDPGISIDALSDASRFEDQTLNFGYTFRRTGPTSGTTVVNFTVGGTAVFSSDYAQSGATSFTTTAGTVTFAPGETTKTVTLHPNPDNAVESNETLILTVVAGTGYNPVATTSRTATIVDDDSTVTLSSVLPSSVNENGGTGMVYTFTRTAPASNALTVNVVISGTANFSGDYTTSGFATNNLAGLATLTFAVGSTTKTVTITPSGDTTNEANETAILTVAANGIPAVTGGFTVGSPSSQTGTILNDDFAPTVTFVTPASGPAAGGTSVTITGTNLTGATGVTFGGTVATGLNVVNATTLTCITPTRPAGSASVIVTTPGGSNAANTLYTYGNPPTHVILFPASVAENAETNATVGILSTTDLDGSDTHTYSFVPGGGDTDNGLFNLSGATLRLTGSADFENKPSYSVRIQTQDAQGGTHSEAFSIAVLNRNEMPSFTKGADQTLPNGANTAQSLSGWASSIDDGDSTVAQALTFNVTNNNNPLFTVQPTVSSTGLLTFTPAGTAGVATVSVSLTDDSSINGHGALTSPAQTFTITVQSLADYSITSTAGVLTITDNSGNSDTLNMAEPSTGNISFAATGRTFSVNGAANIISNSGSLSLAGISSVVVNTAAGADTINVPAFTTAGGFPSLSISGGTGNDSIIFNGGITFASGGSLDVDLQDDQVAPGEDRITVVSNTNLLLSGSGGVVFKASGNVIVNTGAALEVQNGNLLMEANQQTAATAGSFNGVELTNARVEATGTGSVTLRGRSGNSGSFLKGVALQNNSQLLAKTGGITLAGQGQTGHSNVGNFGVGIGSSSTVVRVLAAGGDVSITGVGGATGAVSLNHGVILEYGADVGATGAGRVTVHGTGGNPTGTGGINHGITMAQTGTKLTTENGKLTLTGVSGGGAGSSNNQGVQLSAETFGATGTGDVEITGTAGGAGSGSGIVSAVAIASAGGDVTLNGTAAPGGGIGVSLAGVVNAGGATSW